MSRCYNSGFDCIHQHLLRRGRTAHVSERCCGSGHGRPVRAPSHRQRFQHPGRHRQRLRQPDRQPRPAAVHLPDGRAGLGQEHVPVEHRRPADLVHHPRQSRRLHRPQEGNRLPRRDEPGDGAGRRAVARGRRGGALRRAAEAQRAARRPRVLSGAVRQDRRRGLQGREAAPPRQEHDLRRRAVAPAPRRPGRDGEGAPPAARQEDQGDRAEHGRARGGRQVRRRASRQARSVLDRAARQDRRA